MAGKKWCYRNNLVFDWISNPLNTNVYAAEANLWIKCDGNLLH